MRAFRPYKSGRGRVATSELRERVEAARLDLRALFRSLDRRRLLQDLPRALRTLMELDADLGEALWVLQQPRSSRRRFDLDAMERDTLASLAEVPEARERVLALVAPGDREDLAACMAVVRPSLAREEAYTDVPDRGTYTG